MISGIARSLKLNMTLVLYNDDRYSNLFLNAYINRHADTENLKMIEVFSPLGIWHVFACGALAASISVGIVIPSTWFIYLYKQTVSITVVVLSTVIKTGTTAQIE